MQHYNSMKIYGDKILAGTKCGELHLISCDALHVIDHKSSFGSTIMAIDIVGNVYAALLANFRVITGTLENNKILVKNDINGINYIIEDGRNILRSESQGICLSPNGEYVAFRTPMATCAVLNLNESENLVYNTRFDTLADIVTIKWTTKNNLFIGFNDGHVGRLKFETGEIDYFKLEGVDESVHWFERINDNEFLVATDARCVVKIDENTLKYKVGKKFSKDDFEHITYDAINNVAYASSFDRNIYTINVSTLEMTSLLYKADFKTRWMDIQRDNDITYLFIQVRNGSIVKINAKNGDVIGTLKTTTPAIWSHIEYNNSEYFFGEDGGFILDKNKIIINDFLKKINHEYLGYYIKRSVTNGEKFAVGGTNGKVIISDIKNHQIHDVKSPVRDICFGHNNLLYVATEGGNVYSISESVIESVYKNESEPVWSIAFNEQRNMLALGERMGSIVVLNTKEEYKIIAKTDSRLPKRMKWLSIDKLAVVSSNQLDLIEYYPDEKDWNHTASYYHGGQNTIEDFIVVEQELVVGINYNRYIQVWDLDTGEVLGKTYWDIDYAKGIMYKGSKKFIVYGRNRRIKEYLIHDNDILISQVIA